MGSNAQLKTRIYWIAWLRISFWSAVVGVTTLSLLPVEQLPPIALDWWDKAQHALAFTLLAVLGFLAYPFRNGLVVVGLSLLGAFIELAQYATGWRYGEWSDWIADATGIIAAWLVLFGPRTTSCRKN